jgi:CheY-like chemotaxis protein
VERRESAGDVRPGRGDGREFDFRRRHHPFRKLKPRAEYPRPFLPPKAIPPAIDLVLTDIVMPQMNGVELARRLSAILPSARMLFMSGYTGDAIAKHGMLEPGIAFLQKPFRPADLARKVREVLDTTPVSLGA